MTYRILIQPRAEREIVAAARYIRESSRSRELSLRWVQRPSATIETLRANPFRCPVDPDSEVYGREVRVLLHGKRRGCIGSCSPFRRIPSTY